MKPPVLPPVQENAQVFYYASQTCFWIFLKTSKNKLLSTVGEDLDRLGFIPADFGESDAAYVVVKPMFFGVEFGNQTPEAPGMTSSTEVEFCTLVYPKSRARDVPEIRFNDYILGWEQQKVIGQVRLDVLCDSEVAVAAGRANFGEHKFLGSFTYHYPTPNQNLDKPTPFRLKIAAYTWQNAGKQQSLMFRLNATVDQLNPTFSDFAPEVLYSAKPPEYHPGEPQRAIGQRRSYKDIFQSYLVSASAHHLDIQYGDAEGAKPLSPVPPFGDGKPIAGSESWPGQMRDQMKLLVSDADVKAYLLLQSQPVEFEPRPFYVDVTESA